MDSVTIIVTGCAFNTCGRDEAKNAMQIYNQLDEFYKQHGYDDSKLEDAMKVRVEGAIVDDSLDSSIKVSCYGDNEGTVFMTYINSSLVIGLGTIPIIVFVFVVVAFIKFATPGMKIVTLRCIFMPYFCITDRKTTTTYLCNHRGPCGKGYCCY